MKLGLVLGAYDPLSSTIRLPYDWRSGNMVDDPSFVHELAHYGQTLLTECGQTYAVVLNELYDATREILRAQEGMAPPLSTVPPELQKSEAWTWANLARNYIGRVIGGADLAELARFEKAAARYPADAFLDTSASEPPIRFLGAGPVAHSGKWAHMVLGTDKPECRVVESNLESLPSVEAVFRDGSTYRFPLDASFILEAHARTVSCIHYIHHKQLDLNEQFDWFLLNMRDPYFLPTAIVDWRLQKQTGQEIHSFADAVLLCNLCCLISLCLVPGDAANIPTRTVVAGRARLNYLAPGEVFVHSLGIALEYIRKPGDVGNHFFELLNRVLGRLGAPDWSKILDRQRHNVERYAAMVQGSGTEEYNDFWRIRFEDSQRAIDWWKKRLHSRELWEFILAPAFLTADLKITGPLVIGPNRSGSSSGVPLGQWRAQAFSAIMRKIWDGKDLSCFEPEGGPFGGSIIDCEHAPNCVRRIADHSVCADPIWISCLRQFGVPQRLFQV